MATITISTKKLWGIVSAIGVVLGIVASLSQIKGCGPAEQRSKITTTASERPRPDSIPVHDTIVLTRWRLQAQANRHDTLIDTQTIQATNLSSGLSRDSSVSCLDTAIWTGDTAAIGPDTMSICHDMKSDRFLIDLRPAMRVFNKELFFTARDSIINRLDSITITKAGPSENFFDSALKIIGAIAIGFLLGKTL